MTTDQKDAEIARLSASRIDIAREADRLQARTEKAEAKVITLTEQVDAIAAHRDEVMAERDAALALVAGAYEAAAQITENDKTLHEWEHTAAIRALTPAHALAALSRRDAQMRMKGMRKAAEIVERFGPPDWEATAGEILAAAEKEKGNG